MLLSCAVYMCTEQLSIETRPVIMFFASDAAHTCTAACVHVNTSMVRQVAVSLLFELSRP
jgi:hypothetical protein